MRAQGTSRDQQLWSSLHDPAMLLEPAAKQDTSLGMQFEARIILSATIDDAQKFVFNCKPCDSVR